MAGGAGLPPRRRRQLKRRRGPQAGSPTSPAGSAVWQLSVGRRDARHASLGQLPADRGGRGQLRRPRPSGRRPSAQRSAEQSGGVGAWRRWDCRPGLRRASTSDRCRGGPVRPQGSAPSPSRGAARGSLCPVPAASPEPRCRLCPAGPGCPGCGRGVSGRCMLLE